MNMHNGAMNVGLLSQKSHRFAADVEFLKGLRLQAARAHEFCGSARRILALIAAGRAAEPCFWIRPDWGRERINPEGVLSYANPGKLIFVSPLRGEDLLWSTEETLRSGAVPLVVADLPEPPSLTAVRRLHLAAETGAERTGVPPTAILLAPGEGGAPGIETRWHMAPRHAGDMTRWRLERRRARSEPPKAWHVVIRGSGPVLESVPESDTVRAAGTGRTLQASDELNSEPQLARLQASA